jgi:RsiW-degrading membrane proteinase PrsW (M82 family)
MGFTMLGAAPPGVAGAKPAPTTQQAFKDRNLRFFAVTLVCALLGMCCMSCMVILPALRMFPGQFIVASTVAFLPAFPYLMLYKFLDRNGQIPYKNFFACFFWGATVACGFSVVANTFLGALAQGITNPSAGDTLTKVVIAPLFEESTKGLAVLVVFLILRDEFDNALEGMLLGAASGLGFAVVENCTYFTNFLIQGGAGALLIMGSFRIFTIAFIGHPVYTSMTGLGLGLARELGKSPLRFVTPVVGWCLAVFFHALWNGMGTVIPALVGDDSPFLGLFLLAVFIGGGTLLFFFAVLIFALVKERRVLVRYLKDEVDRGFIEADELAGFSSLFGRERFVLAGLNKGTYKLRKELRRAQLELAFRKWHLEQGDAVKGTVVDADLLDARTRIRDARNALNAREGRDRRAGKA